MNDQALQKAAALMAERLRAFRRLADQARESQSRIDLDPCELWERADEAALIAYEDSLNKINGAQPLPMEIPA